MDFFSKSQLPDIKQFVINTEGGQQININIEICKHACDVTYMSDILSNDSINVNKYKLQTFSNSTQLVTMTIPRQLYSHIIRQKSSLVAGSGPWVAIYSRRES